MGSQRILLKGSEASGSTLPAPHAGLGKTFFITPLAALFLIATGVFPLQAQSPAERLKSAREAFNSGKYTQVLETTAQLASDLPQLADYVAWLRASAESELDHHAAVTTAVVPIWSQPLLSPMSSRAAMLAVRSYMELQQPGTAIDLLRERYELLPQPQADLALADALRADGQDLNAAIYYQRVYFGYPTTDAAKKAAEALKELRQQLGDRYPPEMGHDMLRRAEKLLNGGQPTQARAEYEALVEMLGGADRDLARVRAGVARYMAAQNTAAYTYLAELKVDDAEADAERLDYLSQSARRLERLDDMNRIAAELAEKYPYSPWTAEAMLAAGNRHLTDNNVAAYEPQYQACFEALPGDARTDICHWKVTWAHYLRRDGDAFDWLRQHLELYPASGQNSAVLYFLGRISEQAGDKSAAFSYFTEAATEYPNHFYATIARERLAFLQGVGHSAEVREFLSTIAFPQRAHSRDFTMEPRTQQRIDRARLLASAGINDWAELELSFAADAGEQPHVMAMELSRMLAADRPEQAVRYIKRHASGYLYMPLDSAPQEFWEMTFPLPYRNILMKHADTRQVDPYLMAGLVRQESEFSASVVSRSGARGLSQIMPATGQDLAGRLKVPYSNARLNDPDYNLQLGTYYIKVLLNATEGRPEVALAGYNAGLTRARRWLTWGDFREPAEFIETIPFTETRNYVQSVLRNAATYHSVYDPK